MRKNGIFKWMVIVLMMALMAAMATAVAFAEDEEDFSYPEGFTPSIPIIVVTVDGGQDEVDMMNADPLHNYKCKGKVDIRIPEGFSKYVDLPKNVSEYSFQGYLNLLGQNHIL